MTSNILAILLIAANFILVATFIVYLQKLHRSLKSHTDKALRKSLNSQKQIKDLLITNFNRVKGLEIRLATHDTSIYRQFESLLNLGNLISPEHRGSLSGLRGFAISPDALLIVCRFIEGKKPKTIIEYGSGVSTIVLALLVKKYGGKIISYDHSEEYALKTVQMLHDYGVEDVVELRIRNLTKIQRGSGKPGYWYDTTEDKVPKGVDMVLVDGPPASTGKLARLPALWHIQQNLNVGASIFLDDYNRPDEKDVVRKWLKEKPELVLTSHYTEKGLAELSFIPK